MVWKEDKTVDLIKLYHKNENLWLPKNPLYKNKIQRNVSIHKIAEELEETAEEIERKITVILSMYRRSRSKIAKMTKSGWNINDINQSMWYGYKHMKFLTDRQTSIIRKAPDRIDTSHINSVSTTFYW